MSEGSSYFLQLAQQQLAQGNARGAVETLRRHLTDDPDDVAGHALLAIALLEARRVHAAAHEAAIALQIDPGDPLAHHAAAHVAIARRNFGQAEEHLRILLEAEPGAAANHRTHATLRSLQGREREALQSLEHARTLDPDDPRTLIALAQRALASGDHSRAGDLARAALEIDPESAPGLAVMGFVLLHHGEVDQAREHALQALRVDPQGRDALLLLSAIKARQNWFLGLWWRYSTWMGTLGAHRAILVLLGAFALYRLALIAVQDGVHNEWAVAVQLAWLAICIYTWVGPGLFERSLAKELRTVSLHERY